MMKLQLSKGFHLQFHQIARLLEQAKVLHSMGEFSPHAAAEAMGFSMGKVESIASFGSAMGVLKPKTYLPTAFGELVLGQDTYFDDVGTLWLCHYYMATDPRCVVWQRMVNHVLPQNGVVDADGAKAYFSDLSEHFSAQSVARHLRKELHVFFNAYTEQQFNRLHYLVEENGKFHIGRPVPVPDLVFAAAVVMFRDHTHPKSTAVDIPTLCSADNSVGRVFAMNETTVREMLERLHRRGVLTIESRADLDQVRLPTPAPADIGSSANVGEVREAVVDPMRQYYSERWR